MRSSFTASVCLYFIVSERWQSTSSWNFHCAYYWYKCFVRFLIFIIIIFQSKDEELKNQTTAPSSLQKNYTKIVSYGKSSPQDCNWDFLRPVNQDGHTMAKRPLKIVNPSDRSHTWRKKGPLVIDTISFLSTWTVGFCSVRGVWAMFQQTAGPCSPLEDKSVSSHSESAGWRDRGCGEGKEGAGERRSRVR